MAHLSQTHRTRMFEFLTTYLSTEELAKLCFLLEIEYEDLPGTTRESRALELVQACQRRHIADKLVCKCRELRPRAAYIIADIPPLAPPVPSPGITEPEPQPRNAMPLFATAAVAVAAILILLVRPQLASWISDLRHAAPSNGPAPSVPPTQASSQATSPNVSSSSFVGTWQVSEQTTEGYGTSVSSWSITVEGDTISIEEVSETVSGTPMPSDRREQLSVSHVTIDDTTITFTVKRSGYVTINYTLKMIAADRIEGTYNSVDTLSSDIGVTTGDGGHDTGTVIMTKQER